MKTTFKLKVLTPMFMGGADPEGAPELRPASIRGAMRFWFRVIAVMSFNTTGGAL